MHQRIKARVVVEPKKLRRKDRYFILFIDVKTDKVLSELSARRRSMPAAMNYAKTYATESAVEVLQESFL